MTWPGGDLYTEVNKQVASRGRGRGGGKGGGPPTRAPPPPPQPPTEIYGNANEISSSGYVSVSSKCIYKLHLSVRFFYGPLRLKQMNDWMNEWMNETNTILYLCFLCNIFFYFWGHLLVRAWPSLMSCQHCIIVLYFYAAKFVLDNKFIHSFIQYTTSFTVIDKLVSWCARTKLINSEFFKPPPPVGAGGGYMFSSRPSVPLSVRASVRPCVRASVIHVVVLCFRDISSICWRIFAKLLSLVHLGTQMTWLRFWVKRSKLKVTPSWRRRTALDATVKYNFF